MGKLEKYQRYVPSLYRPKTNTMVRGLLYSWSGEDDAIVSAIQDAKEQLYVLTAQLNYLDSLGSNVGVFRPSTFNLADELFRKLIPYLSFSPKQVIPTIKKVLGVFFGESNPKVKVFELRPNQIEIQIPSTVPALGRSLKGSHHFHNYSGDIVSIDTVLNEMVINLDGDTKILKVDELQGGQFGQGYWSEYIESNTAGSMGVTLQFSSGADLTVFDLAKRFVCTVPKYPGSFLPDTTAAFTVTKERGLLGQSIAVGDVLSAVTMIDSSGIPDGTGKLVFAFGKSNQEGPIKYYGRPNNTTILVDPVYAFTKAHLANEIVNVVQTPYVEPSKDGSDYSVYLVGITAARILAQQIVESLKAAGIVINWTIVEPIIDCSR